MPAPVQRRYLSARHTVIYLDLASDDDEPSMRRGLNALYQWVHRGEIPYLKIGRRLRFDRVVLDEWMAERRRHKG